MAPAWLLPHSSTPGPAPPPPQVLCQARGASTAAVIAELRALGCNGAALRKLYAGCGSAALCSAAIGAVYLLTFYSAKRVGAAFLAQQQQQLQQLQQQQQQPSGRQQQPAKHGSACGSQLADGGAGHPPLSCEGTHPLVASLAGVVASLAGSVFEAPMEMFKLRTQVGAAAASGRCWWRVVCCKPKVWWGLGAVDCW